MPNPNTEFTTSKRSNSLGTGQLKSSPEIYRS